MLPEVRRIVKEYKPGMMLVELTNDPEGLYIVCIKDRKDAPPLVLMKRVEPPCDTTETA